MPVLRVVVRSPDDVGESEDLLCDRPNSVVAVSVRRPPEGGDLSVVGVGEDLHRPSELGDDALVGEGRHVRVRPGVDGKVLAGDVSRLEEDVRVAWKKRDYKQ